MNKYTLQGVLYTKGIYRKRQKYRIARLLNIKNIVALLVPLPH